MPSLSNALAAIIAHNHFAEVEEERQFAAFPSFFFPITTDALAANNNKPAAFDFVHRINMIPDAPEFNMSARFVWDVYERVLNDRRLPANSDPQRGYARRFAEAKAQFGHGQMTTAENTYFTTVVTPKDIDSSAAWTKVGLNREIISSGAGSLPGRVAGWLERFNTLPVLGEDIVDSVSFEKFTGVVLRHWYDPNIFTLKFWDLDGEPISDGGDPPRGRMPGVPAKVVALRNVVIKLARVRMPDIGPTLMYRRLNGGSEAPLPTIGDQISHVSAAGLRPKMLSSPLSPLNGPVRKQIASLATEEAAPSVLTGGTTVDSETRSLGAQKFHVPFVIDSSEARLLAQAELDQAITTLMTKKGELDGLKQRITAIQEKIDQLSSGSTGGGPFGIHIPRSPLAAEWKLKLAAEMALEPLAEEQTAAAEAERLRCERALQLLDQIDRIEGTANAYTLMIVCDRIPKSPDPDPTLFANQ
ncbi:hypothetical protein ABIF70_005210 [Bradyrhizobium japonicum]